MTSLYDTIGQFVTVPHTVVKLLPQIGEDAFVLWTYFRYRTHGEYGVAFPKYETIVADTTMTRSRIAAAIKVLEHFGLLECQRRFARSTMYYIKAPPPEPEVHSSTRRTNEEPAEKRHSSTPRTDISPPVGLTLVQGVYDNNKTDLNQIESTETELRVNGPGGPLPLPDDLAAEKAAILARLKAEAHSEGEGSPEPEVPPPPAEEPEPKPRRSRQGPNFTAPPGQEESVFYALAEICAYDLSMPGKGATIAKYTKQLSQADVPYTAAELRLWRQNDWRPQAPAPWTVVAEIGSVRTTRKVIVRRQAEAENPAMAAAMRYMEREGITEEVEALQVKKGRPPLTNGKSGAKGAIIDGNKE